MTDFDPHLVHDPGGFIYIQGECTNVMVKEPAAPFPVPDSKSNFVIDPRRAFTVSVGWDIYGYLTSLWLNALDDNWLVSVYAESMGPGPELLAGQQSVPVASFTPVADPAKPFGRHFEADVTIPANTFPEGEPPGSASGVFKLMIRIWLNSSLGAPGYDMTGFHEGPFITAENPT